MRQFRGRSPAAMLAVAMCAAIAGCSNQGSRALKLDKDVAKKSLTTFLEAWKKGESPDALKNGTPSIIVGDDNFKAGKKLLSYKIVSDDKDDGTNMRAEVELTLVGKGSDRQQKLFYLVGTSPTITIFPE